MVSDPGDSPDVNVQSVNEPLFDGPGEMRALCREFDWSRTTLGEPSGWAPALRTMVRAALESPFPINLWCGDDLVLIYNDAYRPVLGGKHPRALGRSGSDVWNEIWPQVASMIDRIRESGDPAYAQDAPFVVQRGDHDTGAQEPNAWFTFSLSPVRDEDGSIVAYLNIVSETTSRLQAEWRTEAALAAAEKAEARLREVFAQAPAFLAVLRGESHTFEYVNAAYYQLVGHRELLGKPVWDALPEMRGQGFEQLLNQVLETGQPFVGREVAARMQRTPGGELEERFIDLVYYPITEPDGTRSGVVAHGADVTPHVLAREAAQRARADAEHANQAKSQFLANMSHEIRTPINAVLGYAGLLDAHVGGELNTAQREYVSRIQLSSKHLLALVDDVLDLSKIEAGEMGMHTEVTSPAAVIDATLQMVAPQAAARDLEVKTSCDDAPQFAGDPDRVRQILLNLLSNAVKFTEPGGRIDIRCGRSGEWMVLDVEDTGPGIEPEEQERIFEAFVQVDSGYTRRAGGTGLGLTISRRLARLMGGDLTVESEQGRGSTFSLRLPAA